MSKKFTKADRVKAIEEARIAKVFAEVEENIRQTFDRLGINLGIRVVGASQKEFDALKGKDGTR